MPLVTSSAATLLAAAPGFLPDPYLDYGRFLTPEGGILITYKDLDTRWRYIIWRYAALIASTAGDGWLVYDYSPVESFWLNLVCLVAAALINWWIVWQPVEIYRRIEVRPDCLIIDGKDTFWRRFMDGGAPSFEPDDDDNQILCGIYGTRFVEYLTLRRFDECDRQPEVFAAHLRDAIERLWTD